MDIYKLVSAYYELGLQHKDIAHIISETHNRPISRRQVRRVLERQGLGRRQNYTDISDVIDVIGILLKGSAQLLGYRMMWRRLTHMGIHIPIYNGILYMQYYQNLIQTAFSYALIESFTGVDMKV